MHRRLRLISVGSFNSRATASLIAALCALTAAGATNGIGAERRVQPNPGATRCSDRFAACAAVVGARQRAHAGRGRDEQRVGCPDSGSHSRLQDQRAGP